MSPNGTNGNPAMKRNIALLLAAVIILVGGLGWYAYSKAHKTTSNTLTGGWAEYKATKYGFKFEYPQVWGSPNIVDDSTIQHSAQAPKTVKQTGKRYNITFPDASADQQPKSSVTINFTSTDYSSTSCITSDQCGDSPAFTADNVKRNIKYNKRLLSHDATSTAELHYAGGTGILYIEQIASIPKINVSAVNLAYLLPQASKDCVNNKLTASEGCITESNYNDLNRIAKSIKAI